MQLWRTMILILFCLMQTPSKRFMDTERYSYGNAGVDSDVFLTNRDIVSLETCSQNANFDLGYSISQPS